jgi:hypothetical protein
MSKVRVSFDIGGKSHPDHLPETTLRVIHEISRDGETIVVVPPQAGIFIAKVRLPDHLPDLRNALRGPASGEAPVPESSVFYGVRGKRPCISRLTALPSQPTRFATLIVGALEEQADGSWKGVLFTCYGDNAPSNDTVIAPQEPGDKFAPAETLAERVEFWQSHALSTDIPPEWVPALGVATFAEFASLEGSQAVADRTNKAQE